MDYNKEEADRAIDIAMNKFLANDFAGAKRFALKAQSLNPDIVGIRQMVATFHMHLAAQHTINGEMDYYGVLGAHPQADLDILKKCHLKLVLILHPDWNKSIGAGDAFNFVSTAWGVLSDEAKRAEYDSRRNNEGGGEKSGVQKAAAAAKEKTPNRGVKRASDASTSPSAPLAPPALASPAAVATTHDGPFWTVCSSCRSQYQYHRIYLNQNLLCRHCRNPFIAVAIAPPHSGSIPNPIVQHQFGSLVWDPTYTARTNQNAAPHGSQPVGRESTKRVVTASVESPSPFLEHQFGSLDLDATVYTAGTNQNAAPHGSQPVGREFTKMAVTATTPSTNPPKRTKVVENAVVAGSNVGSSSSAPPKSNSVREFSDNELRNVLVKKSKPTIVTNLHDLFTIDLEPAYVNMVANAGSSQGKSAIEPCRVVDSVADTTSGSLTINVPHAGFCDFNRNRTEKSFGDDQIWASYDSFDKMPRVYFMIEKVLSVDPFKVCITKLTTPETNSKLLSSKCLGSGTQRTCGVFRAEDSEILKSPSIFSHKVEVVKGNHHGEFFIYPRAGDVWAMYKNWSHDDWSYLEGGNKGVEYDVVEVAEGYTEDSGVTVVPLKKVAGYKSVFRPDLDAGDFRSFSKDELSRFSHQIPSYLITGGDSASNGVVGCRELDPAATPIQLLKVIGE